MKRVAFVVVALLVSGVAFASKYGEETVEKVCIQSGQFAYKVNEYRKGGATYGNALETLHNTISAKPAQTTGEQFSDKMDKAIINTIYSSMMDDSRLVAWATEAACKKAMYDAGFR